MIRFICDKCGKEIKDDNVFFLDLQDTELQMEYYQLCETCANKFRKWLEVENGSNIDTRKTL